MRDYTVLVVGGAGYIGSVTVERLVDSGCHVVVVDDLSRGHREAVVEGARLAVGDIADADFMHSVFTSAPFDAVMHFGAHSLVGQSVGDPISYYRNNVSKGIELVNTMADHGVRRFIFSSTAAIFGEPETVPITEEAPKQPTNPYGRTKLYFERFLADCDTAYNLHSVCLRYFNAAGASEMCGEDHDPETHLIPLVLQVAAGMRENVAVFGNNYPTRDGTCIRDYIHVSDLAQAHVLALEHLMENDKSEAFNLGNGEGFTVLEVVQAVERVTGRPVPIRIAERRPGDPAVLVASSEKIRQQLGWKPGHPDLESIVQSAWAWMQAHPKGYQVPEEPTESPN